jgi:acetyl-CoA synthetase
MGAFLADGAADVDLGPTAPDTPAMLHFTSGTTGPPKGAVHVHDGVVAHQHTGRLVLDLQPDDVYWCTADPGWVTGTSYGIIAPLVCGVTSIVDEAEFDPARWFALLERHAVDVLYTSPTALRMLRRAGPPGGHRPGRHGAGRLRLVAAVGEALDAGTVAWAEEAFGCPVLDTWWQTETGTIMIANRLGESVRRGSMGRPVPGVEATLLARHDDGSPVLAADGTPVPSLDGTGELALRRDWPSMFRSYLGDDERYAASFSGDWYRTGDIARRDDDGYYWFVGRGDDLITTAGHFVGPAEVEAVLEEHPAVTEAAAVGTPDPTAGAVVKAFVVLADGAADDPSTLRALLAHGRARLGASIAPREIVVVEALPHTPSGKIMRRSLAARERGGADADPTSLQSEDAPSVVRIGADGGH